jgi:chromate transporter
MPKLASIDWIALALIAAALVATFRFRVGMITLLAGWSVAGLLLHLAGAVG